MDKLPLSQGYPQGSWTNPVLLFSRAVASGPDKKQLPLADGSDFAEGSSGE